MTVKKDEKNQAAELEKLFSEITEHEQADAQADEQTNIAENKEAPEFEIDILNLPPRSEVHLSNSKRLKITLNRPLIRFLFVIIFIIGIAIGTFYIIGIERLFFFTS